MEILGYRAKISRTSPYKVNRNEGIHGTRKRERGNNTTIKYDRGRDGNGIWQGGYDLKLLGRKGDEDRGRKITTHME